VPRAYASSMVIECTTVRCEQRGQRLYKIGLAATTPIDDPGQTRKAMTLTSRRTKFLFLAFGLVSLVIVAIWPL